MLPCSLYMPHIHVTNIFLSVAKYQHNTMPLDYGKSIWMQQRSSKIRNLDRLLLRVKGWLLQDNLWIGQTKKMPNKNNNLVIIADHLTCDGA